MKAQFLSEDIGASKKQKLIRNLSLLAALLLCLATVIGYFASVIYETCEEVEYPLDEDNIDLYGPYVQQFDAFMKGQLHIDYEPSRRFLKLENPYDPEERDSAYRVYYLYDRAYYDGHYYSYFGTAPIFTVMAPYYAITGNLPSDGTIQLVFMLVFAMFMTLTVFILIEKIAPCVPPPLCAFISYVAYISSMQLMYARGRLEFYYVAATAAMAFASAFAYFFFKGLFAKKTLVRSIFFLLAGLFFALCVHSRLNTALTLAFFIIPLVLFGIVFKKREAVALRPSENPFGAFCRRHRVGSIAIELACLAIFVAVGFGLAFAFNKARFGSMLEFGAKYQLTVGDATKYKLDLSEFGYSVFHYFLAPIHRESTASLTYYEFELERFLYVDAHFGILELPLMWGAFICPFAFMDKKRSMGLKVGTLCALLGCFVTAWIDFCMGGVIFRYLCDISAVLAVLGAIGIALVLDRLFTLKNRALRYTLICAIAVFLMISLCRALSITVIDNGNLLELTEGSLFRIFKIIP